MSTGIPGRKGPPLVTKAPADEPEWAPPGIEDDDCVVNVKPGLAFETVQSRVPDSKPPLMTGLVHEAEGVVVSVVVAMTVSVKLDGGIVIVAVLIAAEAVVVMVVVGPDLETVIVTVPGDAEALAFDVTVFVTVMVEGADVGLIIFEPESTLVTVSVVVTVIVARAYAELGVVCLDVTVTVELAVTVLVIWATFNGHEVGVLLYEEVVPKDFGVEHIWVAVTVIVLVTCLTSLRSLSLGSAAALLTKNSNETSVVKKINERHGIMTFNAIK